MGLGATPSSHGIVSQSHDSAVHKAACQRQDAVRREGWAERTSSTPFGRIDQAKVKHGALIGRQAFVEAFVGTNSQLSSESVQ